MEGRLNMALEITIDEGACMGARECSFWAPGVFGNHDNGTAYVIDREAASEDKVIEAAQHCPNFAIAVFKDGKRLV
jgi:ferredoxin